MKRILRIFIFATILTSWLLGFSVTSHAVDQYSEVRAKLATYGVPAHDQDVLIGKLRSNVPWDSFSGAAPTSTRTNEVSGRIQTIATYADGSISATEVSVTSEDEVDTQGISECLKTHRPDWVLYKNCVSYHEMVLYAVSFRFDYRFKNNSNNRPEVLNARDPYLRIIAPGGSFSDRRFVRIGTSDVRMVFEVHTSFTSVTAYIGARGTNRLTVESYVS